MINSFNLVALALLTLPSLHTLAGETHDVAMLSPSNWRLDQIEEAWRLNNQLGGQNQLATSTKGVVVGSTGAPAVRAGIVALDCGGSAADAALTTALTQIVLSQGSWNSFAGILILLYFDAETNQVYCINAGYNTVRGETDPLTIPKKESGRTALVPGFMAGVEFTHKRFGKLPFASLFAPAIYFAEQGFEIGELNARLIASRQSVLSRLSETKQLFTNPDTGLLFAAGDTVKQLALAETLRGVAEHGAEHMYSGEWAQHMVAAVESDGGTLALTDLDAYEPKLTTPIAIPYGDHAIMTPGVPAFGGVHVAETMNLCIAADVSSMGHYAKSPEAFFWLSQFNTIFSLSYVPANTQKLVLGKPAPLALRSSPEFARQVWTKMRDGEIAWTKTPKDSPEGHSDAVVAIDQFGNVAALVHTINTISWGNTGIFVDGVSIPDSAAFQQSLVKATGPGRRLPDVTAPLIVLQSGQPVFAIAAIGAGLHAKTVCTLLNLLDHGMDIQDAINSPAMLLPAFSADGKTTHRVLQGDFGESLIKQVSDLGLPIQSLTEPLESRSAMGYAVGASINSQDGRRAAISTKYLNAPAMGQVRE